MTILDGAVAELFALLQKRVQSGPLRSKTSTLLLFAEGDGYIAGLASHVGEGATPEDALRSLIEEVGSDEAQPQETVSQSPQEDGPDEPTQG